MGDAAFLTLILRVLGYDDSKGDFVWNNPYTLAKTAGLVNSEAADADFTRGDAFVICYRALTATVKSGDSIKDQLIAKGVFTAETFAAVSAAATPVTKLLSIGDLNTNYTAASHANDDIATASLEINYRETVELTSANTTYTRYDNAWYPRIKKVKDDLYLLLYMYGQFGRHLYWTTSADGKTFGAPEVLWGADNSKKFVHDGGPLVGTEDQYVAVNADACVLDNGEILCVYAIRPNKGYNAYMDLSGIFMMRGTVSADNKITWGEEVKLTAGQVWEPFIWQRPDGQVEIYWSNAAPYVEKYGFDEEKRSTGTSMIASKDNGFTWTPSLEEGKANNYLYTRVYQEYIGDKVPFGAYSDAVPYFGGQMPAATALYNGKTLLALEVQKLDKDFAISLATSLDGGEWKSLGITEEGPEGTMKQPIKEGASPYLATFPSGEVYLTYTLNAAQRGRLISPDGSVLDSKEFRTAPGASGSWGASEVVGSHKVLSVNPDSNGGTRGISIFASYLNHRTNAKRASISVDGYTNDWAKNTDALFVGSETQAQITVQTAHDADNVYFLINRLDEYLTDGDTVTVNIATGPSSYYRVVVGLNGTVTVVFVDSGAEKQKVTADPAAVVFFGTVGNNDDKDEGAVIEFSLPKTMVGLVGKTSFAASPALANQDGTGSTNDGLTGVSAFTTARWPAVVLD